MASSSSARPLQPLGSPVPPPPPPPSPPLAVARALSFGVSPLSVARALSLGVSPQPVARWAPSSSSSSSSTRPRKRRRLARQADGTPFPRVRPSPTTGDGPPAPCSLCGKPFRSHKALHGHVSRHPERPYRGMTAPPEFVSTPSERGEPRVDGLDLLLAAANHVDTLQDGKGKEISGGASASKCSTALDLNRPLPGPSSP